MNVQELIERLEDLDPKAQVLLAFQEESWPLQFELKGVASSEDFGEDEDYPEGPCPEHDREDCILCLETRPSVIYLVEGGHPYSRSPYAPRAAWEAAR